MLPTSPARTVPSLLLLHSLTSHVPRATSSMRGYALALLAAATLATAKCSNQLQPGYDHPVPADGWSWRLVANGMTKPRSITFDSAGALLVLDEGAGINRLVLQDDGGTCLSVKEKTVVVADTAVSNRFLAC